MRRRGRRDDGLEGVQVEGGGKGGRANVQLPLLHLSFSVFAYLMNNSRMTVI